MESDAEAQVASCAVFKASLWTDFLKYQILTVKKLSECITYEYEKTLQASGRWISVMRKTTQLACRGMLEASFVMTTVKIRIYFPIITKHSFYLLLEAVGHLQYVINVQMSCVSKNQMKLRVRRINTFPIAMPQDLLMYFASRSPQITKGNLCWNQGLAPESSICQGSTSIIKILGWIVFIARILLA